MIILTCQKCSKEFEAISRNSRYCNACREMANADNQARYVKENLDQHRNYMKEYHKRPILSKICCECGKPFKTRSKKKTYCNPNCYIKIKSLMVREIRFNPIKPRLTVEKSDEMLKRAADLMFANIMFGHEFQRLTPEKISKLNLSKIEFVGLK